MADTPLAPLTKDGPLSPAKLFMIAALRHYCAALAGVPVSDLPDSFTVKHGPIEVHVTPTTWIVTDSGVGHE